MINLDISGFRPVELSDKAVFDKHLAVLNRMSCECNFNNIFCWGEAYLTRWNMISDRIILFSEQERSIQMPLGEYFTPAEMAEIADYFIAHDYSSGSFFDVPEEYIQSFPDIERYFEVDCPEDTLDYIYLTSDLLELSGAKLSKKRNLIKQFEREHTDHRVVMISKATAKETLKLALRLNTFLDHSHFLLEENSALHKAFTYFDKLDIEGLIVFVGEEPVAFTVFSRQNSESYDVHFEKASRDFKGASQFINHETAKLLSNRCKYLNREQDLGLPGLRKAKQSYSPAVMLKRYTLNRRGD